MLFSGSVDFKTYLTDAETLELLPVIIFPTKFCRYDSTGIPWYVFWTFMPVNLSKYVLCPPVTADPCFRILDPSCSIWFCKIDWVVVNSLAWTG